VQVKEPVQDWEVIGLRKLRDWMAKSLLSSELAFERILQHSSTMRSNVFSLHDFRKALQSEKLPFTVAQLDFLFKVIDQNKDGWIDLQEWGAKIFDDFRNPLQMLREVIVQHGICSDELLYKMSLKIIDPPLDYPAFQRAMRLVDPSMNGTQMKALFNEI
jgi:hypothetical protein